MPAQIINDDTRQQRTAAPTEHSYNDETGLLHRRQELLPKPARQQAEQLRLVSGEKPNVRPGRLLVERAAPDGVG